MYTVFYKENYYEKNNNPKLGGKMIMENCPLCDTVAGTLIWQNPSCRVVLVDDPDYPGFCRVIWRDHVKEMSDLPSSLQLYFMRIVFLVEEALRQTLQPNKINLASLGNVVPHLHWHIIPRFKDDKHFPNPIWADATQPSTTTVQQIDLKILRACITEKLEKLANFDGKDVAE